MRNLLFDRGAVPDILASVFGYTEFRGQQRTIIDRLANRGHSLVIMPTGMGKSLCFQIPAILIRKKTAPKGLTLVLSPLVALMKDQVDALLDKGIAATYVNSSLDRQERLARYAAIGNGQFDLLYVTPERFRKREFLEVIDRRNVELLAVDEAHCISEWGHDFRPDYTRVGEIRRQLGDPVVIALTATATPDVQSDIVRQLNLRTDAVETFHAGIERPNLQLSVQQVWTDDEKLDAILQMRENQQGSGIVYFTLIRKLTEFSDQLTSKRIDHLVYHGELDRIRRKQIQEEFMSAPDRLVLATNAFGMGVDKLDIRFVLHADLPGSLESYYQEIGRAGRDNRAAVCHLLYDERDLATQMEFIGWSNPNADYYRRLQEVIEAEGEKINAFGLDWLRQRIHHKQKHDRRLETALAMLDRWEVTTGSIETGDLRWFGTLPEQLNSESKTAEKLKRDQTKLLKMLQYVQYQGDRKAFINEYFGIAAPESAYAPESE